MSYSTICPVCKKRTTDYDDVHDCGEVCGQCIKKHLNDFDECCDYLKSFSQEEQQIGRTSWTDYVLNRCYGIQECYNPALVTELLGQFEADSILEDADGEEFTIAEDIKDYIREDTYSFGNYLREIYA